MDMEKPLPTDDFVFNYTMASEGSENSLKSFINAVQEDAGREIAEKIYIQNPFNLSSFINGKKSILDVKAIDTSLRRYNVEIQTVNQISFKNRILYYWSGQYYKQLAKGQKYKRLNPAISIVVTRFSMFPDLPNIHNIFNITAEGNPQCILTDHLLIHTVELTPEKMGEPFSISPKLQKWVNFLSLGHSQTEQDMKILIQDDPGLQDAIDRYEFLCQNDELREMALAHEKEERDRLGQLDYATQQGWRKGIKHGMKRGMKKGIQRGIQQGVQQGVQQGQINTLSNSIFRTISRRFPGVDVSNLQNQLAEISDTEKLNSLLDSAIDCTSYEEFCSNL